MKKPGKILFILAMLSVPAVLLAGQDTATESQQNQSGYQALREEAERARQEAEVARAGALRAAELAREAARMHELAARQNSEINRQESETMARERAIEEKELARTREELSRAHRELREATREVARAHRDLSRRNARHEMIHHVNLGDRAVIGVVLGPQTSKGVELIGVSPDGPAERAGLQPGDVLVSIAGIGLEDNEKARTAIFKVMQDAGDGEELAVTVDRGGEIWEYTVVAEQREPLGWQTVIEIPEFENIEHLLVSDVMAKHAPVAPHDSVDRIEVPYIDLDALAAQIDELAERMDTSKYSFVTPDGETISEFEFETYSDFGAYALGEANMWFGLPRAHGLELTTVNEGLGAYFKTDRGVLVIQAREGNAYQLESGDVILSIGSTNVDSPADMMRALRDIEPGSKIDIAIKRSRRDKTLSVVVPENRLGHR